MIYQALQVNALHNQVQATYVNRQSTPLATNEVRVQVAYSAINYKDALALRPNSGVIAHYPLVPGIDLCGWVQASKDPQFHIGDAVVATGGKLGVQQDGGYQEYATVSGRDLHLLNGKRTLVDAMMIGTAGLTAAMGITKILICRALMDKAVPILISGATGGVGGWQLAIMAQLGYHNITAVTRQLDRKPELMKMGATRVVTPQTLTLSQPKPLAKQKYALVLDNLGGPFLSEILPQVRQDGHVVANGNVFGNRLQTTVLPFILRGITLHGVDSVHCLPADREEIWQLFETAFWPDKQRQIARQTVTFKDLRPSLLNFTQQPHFGRTLVKFKTKMTKP